MTDYMTNAMRSAEQNRDEYIGSVYGGAALGLIASIHAADAIDLLQERCPQLYKGAIKRYCGDIMGAGDRMGQLRKLEIAINSQLAKKQDTAWMTDFGIAANEAVEAHITKLRTAIANCLGRFPGIPDTNVCAAVIVAQSLAHEAAAYIDRRAKLFENFTIEDHDGYKRRVSFVLRTMSCAGLSHSLKRLAAELVEKHLTDDLDLLADASVEIGCKAVLNKLASVDTWVFAREKAERLNSRD